MQERKIDYIVKQQTDTEGRVSMSSEFGGFKLSSAPEAVSSKNEKIILKTKDPNRVFEVMDKELLKLNRKRKPDTFKQKENLK